MGHGTEWEMTQMGIPQGKYCPKCEGELMYSEQWDAYYCLEHGWTESQCGGADCPYCKNRPASPLFPPGAVVQHKVV